MNLRQGITVFLLGLLVLCFGCHKHRNPTLSVSHNAQCDSNVFELCQALVRYEAAKGRLPGTLEELAEFAPDIRKLKDVAGETHDTSLIFMPINLKAYRYDANSPVPYYKEGDEYLPPTRYYYDPKKIKIHTGEEYHIVVHSLHRYGHLTVGLAEPKKCWPDCIPPPPPPRPPRVKK